MNRIHDKNTNTINTIHGYIKIVRNIDNQMDRKIDSQIDIKNDSCVDGQKDKQLDGQKDRNS